MSLNYYHRNGGGLDMPLAKGLAVFLNSTLVDAYFRQFNGHTQVNATDLRSMKYPTVEQLRLLGGRIGDEFPGQADLDDLIDQELSAMVADAVGVDPVKVKRRLDEALEVLKALGLPGGQQNDQPILRRSGRADREMLNEGPTQDGGKSPSSMSPCRKATR